MSVLKNLAGTFDAVKSLTGLTACIYDFQKLLTYESGVFKQNLTGHYCEFCMAVRSLKGGRDACIYSDRETTANLARLYKAPFFNVCHAGLTEYIIPIITENKFAGVVFLGQCRIADETDFDAVYANIERFGGSRKPFYELFLRLPEISRAKLSQAGGLLDMSIKWMVATQGERVLDFYTENRHLSIVAKAVALINDSYLSVISAKEISEKLHINQSYLSRMFKDEMGCTMIDYLIRVRINHAKNLIANTKIPIGSIAFNVGYTDQNYFSRHFKRETGMSPIYYRELVKSAK